MSVNKLHGCICDTQLQSSHCCHTPAQHLPCMRVLSGTLGCEGYVKQCFIACTLYMASDTYGYSQWALCLEVCMHIIG